MDSMGSDAHDEKQGVFRFSLVLLLSFDSRDTLHMCDFSSLPGNWA